MGDDILLTVGFYALHFLLHEIRKLCSSCHLQTGVSFISYIHHQQGRNQLFISGGTIFMNFHSMTSSCLFNRGTTVSQTVTDTFFSQHFRKWELISLNQARN